MKTRLIGLLLIMLLVTACGGAKTNAAEKPTVTKGTAAQSDQVMDVVISAGEEASAITQTPSARREATANLESPDDSQPAATYTPYPTYTPFPTLWAEPQNEAPTPLPTFTSDAAEMAAGSIEKADAGEPVVEPAGTSITETITAAPAPTEPPVPSSSETMPEKPASAALSVGLARIPDTDPAPPLTILVSKVQIKGNGYYKLTGSVRNDGSQTYGGIGVIATFYEEANPCTKHEVTRRGRDGSEVTFTVEDCDYNWHGPVKVYAACQLLEPGQECPFSLEIYPEEYVSYMLHPEGTPVEYRQPITLALSSVSVSNNGLGYVRVTGTVTNQNAFAVRDANIIGTLLDTNGQIASVGSRVLPGEMSPGASADFDLRIEYAPYSHYQLVAQATQM